MRRLMLFGLPIAGAGLALLVSCTGLGVGDGRTANWITCTASAAEHDEIVPAAHNQETVLSLPLGHTLKIPANAVDPGTRFRLSQVAGHPLLVMATMTPASETLKEAGVLTLVHANMGCGPVGSTVAIYRAGPNLEPRDRLPTEAAPQGSVAGKVEDFSLFAIAQ